MPKFLSDKQRKQQTRDNCEEIADNYDSALDNLLENLWTVDQPWVSCDLSQSPNSTSESPDNGRQRITCERTRNIPWPCRDLTWVLKFQPRSQQIGSYILKIERSFLFLRKAIFPFSIRWRLLWLFEKLVLTTTRLAIENEFYPERNVNDE